MPRKKLHESDAARVAAYRARRQLVSFSVDLPIDCVEGLANYMRFKNLTRSEVIAKLIRSQLLRSR